MKKSTFSLQTILKSISSKSSVLSHGKCATIYVSEFLFFSFFFRTWPLIGISSVETNFIPLREKTELFTKFYYCFFLLSFVFCHSLFRESKHKSVLISFVLEQPKTNNRRKIWWNCLGMPKTIINGPKCDEHPKI